MRLLLELVGNLAKGMRTRTVPIVFGLEWSRQISSADTYPEMTV